jgi:hypothetical protein
MKEIWKKEKRKRSFSDVLSRTKKGHRIFILCFEGIFKRGSISYPNHTPSIFHYCYIHVKTRLLFCEYYVKKKLISSYPFWTDSHYKAEEHWETAPNALFIFITLLVLRVILLHNVAHFVLQYFHHQ